MAAKKPRVVVLQADEVRICASRADAFAVLRDLGLRQIMHEQFLSVAADGRWIVQTGRAKDWLTSVTGRLDGKHKLLAKSKRWRERRGKRKVGSVASTVLSLMQQGKTNDEVWEVVQPMFDMPDGRKYYMAWYRSHFTRKGLLEKSK